MKTFDMNSPTTRQLRMAALAVLMAATLAACGGNDDPAPTPAPAPPPAAAIPESATASVAGLIAFVSSLLGTPESTAEPLVVGDITLPTSDTTEPNASL